MKQTNLGLIGCGNISDIYLQNCQQYQHLNMVACADIDIGRAQAKAEQYHLQAVSSAELLAMPEIELVLNLTTPPYHAEVDEAVLRAGKSVYSEKPLAIRQVDGAALLSLAEAQGQRIGCAPDTFLGGGLQTCRKLVDDGWIGRPVAATAFMTCHGHENWHPDPAFYYQPGGGPMFDMGPYYLTALINLLGPVTRVTGSTQTTFPTRKITSQPKFGDIINVEVPTHVIGVLEFAAGAIGTIVTSFDVWAVELPRIEIYGTEGTLSLPDPNDFGGEVRLQRQRDGWHSVPLTHGYTDNSRGLGVAEMALAMQEGNPHRASAEMAFHVLEIMQAIHEAAEKGRHINLATRCERPAPLPVGFQFE